MELSQNGRKRQPGAYTADSFILDVASFEVR